MLPEEVKALGDLASAAAAGLTSQIHDMQSGIARRAFDAVGPGALVVRVAHDRVAAATYRGARELTGGLLRAGALALSATRPDDASSLQRSRAGRFAIGALNGAFGDTLKQRSNALAIDMTVRFGHHDVPLTSAGLASVFPRASSRLAVFLHGLCETEDAWELGAARHVPYGYRLQAELGYTPLFIRYNTGLHISDNGRQLAQVMELVRVAWPVPVQEIALIGHSMGGLVARSACHYGAGSDWASNVRHVFALGAPHKGAPLEQVVNAASAALARLPETRGVAKALNLRSVGIKDLRYGYLLDEDWFGIDCDAFLRKQACDVPFLRTANHYFVCATLSREADAPLGRIVGDLLVLQASAWSSEGRGKRMRFPIDHYQHVGGINHFTLLNHPAIYAQIRRWVTSRKQLPARAGN